MFIKDSPEYKNLVEKNQKNLEASIEKDFALIAEDGEITPIEFYRIITSNMK